MNKDGFTLIEALVVVSIIIILAVALGSQFSGWTTRYNVESQIKTIQADLMDARQRAMERNVQYVAQMPAAIGTGYVICEDANGNNVCDAAETTTTISQTLSKSALSYPITWNLPGLAGASLVMNTKGLLKTVQAGGAQTDIDNTAPDSILVLNPVTNAPYGPTATNTANQVDYDCISLSSIRIGLGKYNGTTCVVK